MSLEKENTSDFESQNMLGRMVNSAQAVGENDVKHAKIMKLERNLRSINLTYG